MKIQPLFVSVGISLAVLSAGVCEAAQVRNVSGNVVLARSGANATYLWNATPYVTQLVADKVSGDDAIRNLEASALEALASKPAPSSAKQVTIRVVYERTGAVSPVYGSATFAGIETVLTMSASPKDVKAHHAAWAQNLVSGKTPSQLKIVISGKLPPPQ